MDLHKSWRHTVFIFGLRIYDAMSNRANLLRPLEIFEMTVST